VSARRPDDDHHHDRDHDQVSFVCLLSLGPFLSLSLSLFLSLSLSPSSYYPSSDNISVLFGSTDSSEKAFDAHDDDLHQEADHHHHDHHHDSLVVGL